MSVVKFGRTDKDVNNNVIDRRYGKKADRVTYWKWGEPLSFYILESLKNYLPRFVVQNALCHAILKAIAVQLVTVEQEAQKLPDFVFSGKPALKYANSDLQLHINFNANPEDIKSDIKNAFNIHKQRGTMLGIIKDLRRLTGDNKAYIIYYPYGVSGWWADHTYPEYNGAGKIGINCNVYFDLYNMLDLVYCNHSGRSDKEVVRILRNEIVPVNIDARFLVSELRSVKWGEPYNFETSTELQFGIFVYNQLLGGCGGTEELDKTIIRAILGYGDDYGDDYGNQ